MFLKVEPFFDIIAEIYVRVYSKKVFPSPSKIFNKNEPFCNLSQASAISIRSSEKLGEVRWCLIMVSNGVRAPKTG